MAYIIGSACIDVKDKECIASCPVDCIYEGERMLYISPDQCIDCGSCMPICPTGAIYEDSDTPDNEKVFIQINKDFFINISAETASEFNQIGEDPQYVKEYQK